MSHHFSIEANPGTYALILKVEVYSQLLVGSLGTLQVQPGFYIYVGSACGPGGLKGRLNHHLRRAQKPHWHIDYLRQQAEVQEVWFIYDRVKREHEWAGILLTLPTAQIPFPGFGSSDCTCLSHLIYFPTEPKSEILQRL